MPAFRYIFVFILIVLLSLISSVSAFPGGEHTASTPSTPSAATVPSSSSTGNYTLSWSSISGITHYQWRENKNNVWSVWTTTTSTSALLTARASGSYKYEVQACNFHAFPMCSSSRLSNTITVTRLSPPGTPGAITLSDGSSSSDGAYAISWLAASGSPTRYEYQESANSTWSAWTSVGLNLSTQITGNGNGSYAYKVRACNTAGCGSSRASSTVTVSLPSSVGGIGWKNTGNTAPDAPWSGDTPVLNGNSNVGALEGSGGVSGGAATYNIPIVIPPGRAGMQPSVSLNYSSRSGNGVAGVGWSLSAGSSIHRCSATAAQDKYGKGVTYSTSDKLCLDGQRLIKVSGYYGQSGAQYRTEIDSFSKIVQSGHINSSSSFTVFHKDGRISYYGGTNDSQHKAGSKSQIMSWAISKTKDRAAIANTINYTYYNFPDGENLLNTIFYTGNNGSYGDRKVVMIYENRPDISRSYMSGGLTVSTKRLKEVGTYYQSQLIREYKLTYDTSGFTKRSLVKNIQECASGNCLPATKVKTYQPNYGWQAASNVIAQLGIEIDAEDRINYRDLNGDGINEIIYSRRTNPTANTINTTVTTYARNSSGNYAVVNNITLSNNSELGMTLGDFNGDGISDYGYVNSSDNRLYYRYYTGLNYTLKEEATNIVNPPAHSAEFFDINGDGYGDFIFIGDNVITVYLNKGNGQAEFLTPYTANISLRSRTFPAAPIIREQPSFQDIDGDGILDVLKTYQSSESTLEVSIDFGMVDNNGIWSIDVSRASSQLGLPTNHFSNQFFFNDINGDGLNDYIRPVKIGSNQYDWRARLNLGNRYFSSEISLGTQLGIHEHRVRQSNGTYVVKIQSLWGGGMFVDLDNDGKDELLIPTHSTDNVCTTFIGTPTYQSASEPHEIVVCNDDMHSEEFINDSNKPNYIDFGKYDLRRFQWSVVDFKNTSTGVSLERVISNVVSAPISLHGELDVNKGWKPLSVADFNNDGLLDFSYRLASSYTFDLCSPPPSGVSVNHCFLNVAGQDYHHVALSVQFQSNAPTSGYYEQQNIIGSVANEGKLADTIEEIENGLSDKILWKYAPLSKHIDRANSNKNFYYAPDGSVNRYVATDTKRQNFLFTSSMYVVSDSYHSNGIGGLNQKQYSYREAVYNRMGRGFQGFRSIIVDDLSDTDPNKHIRSVSDFHQKFPLSGKLEQTRTCLIVSGGEECKNRAINLSIYDWDLWRDGAYKATVYNSETDFSSAVLDSAVTDNNYFVAPRTQKDYTYSTTSDHAQNMAVSSNWLTEKYQYWQLSGGLACPAITTSRYQEAGGVNKAETTTNIYYHSADLNNWWLCKPNYSLTTTKAITGRGSDYAMVESGADTQKQVKTTYNSWHSSRKPTSITTIATQGQGTANGLSTIVTTAYNSYGLPTSVITDGDHYTGANMDDRSVSTTYSPDGYFVKTVTNSKGHVTTTNVDPIHGQATQVTDPNNQVTTMTYDAFGRVRSIKLPGEPTQWTAYNWCSGVNGGSTWCFNFPGKQYRVYTVKKGSPRNLKYFDNLNREQYSITRNFKNDGWYLTWSKFNNKGQKAHDAINDSSTGWHYTYYDSYDALGRLTKKRTPQSDGSHMATNYNYDGFVTNIQAIGETTLNMSRKYNGLGQLVYTKDALDGYTRYAYDGAGNPITLQDANGNKIYAKYNALGQKEYVDDPNMGKKFFWYNTFGEVEKEQDANGDVLTYSYDSLGRLGHRWTQKSGESSAQYSGAWVWDNGNLENYRGKVHWEYNVDGNDDRLIKYHYYSKTASGKLYSNRTKHRIYSNQSYQEHNTSHYIDNNYGRPKGMKFGTTGLTLAYDYNDHGYMTKIKNANGGYVYQEIKNLSAHGKITEQLLTNGLLAENSSYHTATGQMTKVKTSTYHGNESRHHLTYSYDGFSNLAMQVMITPNGVQNSEDYQYDKLHRLMASYRTINNGAFVTVDPIQYHYDAVGNIKKKTDYSTNSNSAFNYPSSGTRNTGNGGPNAVQSVALKAGGTANFIYDFNGNIKQGHGKTITYNEFNKPLTISKGGITSAFSYGADLMRYKQVKSGLPGGKTKVIYYIDKLMEKVETKINLTTTKTEYKHYIGDVAIQTKTVTGSTSNWKVRFAHRDRLGSVVTLTDHLGLVIEHRSYDAFGKPRKGDFGDISTPSLFAVVSTEPFTDRGFTDHEHLDDAELIHMNGRAYDYNLGRFLSVDPFIQEPGNSQSMNPYSYIMNNPLSGTDPSGYKSCAEGKLDSCGISKGETVTVVNKDGEATATVTLNKDGSATVNVASDNGKQINTYHKSADGKDITKIGSQEVKNSSQWLNKFHDKANNLENRGFVFGKTRPGGFQKVGYDGEDPDADIANNTLNPEVVKLYQQYLVNLGVAPGRLSLGASSQSTVMNTGSKNASELRRAAADAIKNGERIGTALSKSDAGHRSASFLTKAQLNKGKIFTLKGGDGVTRTLLQTKGSMNGQKGIFEYIITPKGQISHQRFIRGGTINGKPNQRVK